MSLDTLPTNRLPSEHLADEANHRIANHLQILAALARLRGNGAKETHKAKDVDTRLVLEEFAGRLEAVGKVHRLLASASNEDASIDIAEYLAEVAEGLISSLAADGQTTLRCLFRTKCVLPAEEAVTLGLLVGELITNAVKYAHPAGVAGAVGIEAARLHDGSIVIKVCDDGVGLPDSIDPVRSQSIGFRTVRMLANRLGASISFQSRGLGLNCILQMPPAPPFLKAVS